MSSAITKDDERYRKRMEEYFRTLEAQVKDLDRDLDISGLELTSLEIAYGSSRKRMEIARSRINLLKEMRDSITKRLQVEHIEFRKWEESL